MSHNANSDPSSKSFAKDWINFLNALNKQSVLSSNSPKFKEYAIDSFDTKVIIEILLYNTSAYFANKEILFTGLTAWVACPHNLSIVREAMVLAGATKLSRLEKTYKAQLPQDPLLTDVASKLVGPGIDFYRDFYYPMGGLERIIRCRSPILMKRTLMKTSQEIDYMTEFMSIAHYHALYIEKGRDFREASAKSCCIALSAILSYRRQAVESKGSHAFLKDVNPKNCLNRVNLFRTQAALIYAAKSIQIGDKTLLHYIKSGSVDYIKHFSSFNEWMGKSVYAGEKIIAPMFLRETQKEQVGFLPEINATLIQDPVFNEHEQCIIENAFAKPSWHRNNPTKTIKNLPIFG